MSVDLRATYTITAPSAVDGRGEIAVLNDSASGNFVGYLADSSGFESPEVRESSDPIVDGDGGVHGSFYHGRRPFTLDIMLAIAATDALSHARLDKLLRATNAMRADGTIVWTETGSVAKVLNFRRQAPVRGPSVERHCLVSGVSADPRIYANTPQTGASPKTNVGNAGSPPTFTLTPSANGTVVITNTTSGLGSPALTLTVGTGYLAAGSAVTVNFRTKTVTQGGVNKNGSVVFPSSVWWEVVPGANTWSFTNVSSSSISFQDAWI